MAEAVRDRFGAENTPEVAAADAPAPAVDPTVDPPNVSGTAFWDGVPSLGGVWIAHPDVDDPVRVRIARASGGISVEGWLFGRDVGGEGPALQVSSEAAAGLGLAPGESVELTVEPTGAAQAPHNG